MVLRKKIEQISFTPVYVWIFLIKIIQDNYFQQSESTAVWNIRYRYGHSHTSHTLIFILSQGLLGVPHR